MGTFTYVHASATIGKRYHIHVDAPIGYSACSATSKCFPASTIKFKIYSVRVELIKDHACQESGIVAYASTDIVNTCPLPSSRENLRKTIVRELHTQSHEERTNAQRIRAQQHALDCKIVQWLIEEKDVGALKQAAHSLEDAHLEALGRADEVSNMAYILEHGTFDANKSD